MADSGGARRCLLVHPCLLMGAGAPAHLPVLDPSRQGGPVEPRARRPTQHKLPGTGELVRASIYLI